MSSLDLDQKWQKKVCKWEKKLYIHYKNSINTNRWFIGNPHSIFQKDLTDFILIRHSEEEMV